MIDLGLSDRKLESDSNQVIQVRPLIDARQHTKICIWSDSCGTSPTGSSRLLLARDAVAEREGDALRLGPDAQVAADRAVGLALCSRG